jgi:hypothetical protein
MKKDLISLIETYNKINSIKQLKNFAKEITNHFSHNEKFKGNCGVFAYALGKYLLNKYKITNIGLVYGINFNDFKNVNDLIGTDVDIYHVLLDVADVYIDGDGVVNLSEIEKIAKDEYGDLYPTIVTIPFDWKYNEDFILSNTNYSLSVDDIYNKIEQIVNQL